MARISPRKDDGIVRCHQPACAMISKCSGEMADHLYSQLIDERAAKIDLMIVFGFGLQHHRESASARFRDVSSGENHSQVEDESMNNQSEGGQELGESTSDESLSEFSYHETDEDSYSEIDSSSEEEEESETTDGNDNEDPPVARTGKLTQSKKKKLETTCRVCHQVYSSVAALTAHMFIHSNAKPFKCDECSLAFKRKYDLSKHKRVHSNENQYNCEICERGFYSSSNFKRHMRMHNDERAYVCKECGKDFTQISNYKTHMLVHSDELRYQCRVCKMKFRFSSNYRRHLKLH